MASFMCRLTRLRAARIAGQTSLLGVSVRVFLKSLEGLNRTKRQRVNFLSLPELGHPSPPVLRYRCFWLELTPLIPESWAFRLRLNYTAGFPGLPDGRL